MHVGDMGKLEFYTLMSTSSYLGLINFDSSQIKGLEAFKLNKTMRGFYLLDSTYDQSSIFNVEFKILDIYINFFTNYNLNNIEIVHIMTVFFLTKNKSNICFFLYAIL